MSPTPWCGLREERLTSRNLLFLNPRRGAGAAGHCEASVAAVDDVVIVVDIDVAVAAAAVSAAVMMVVMAVATAA